MAVFVVEFPGFLVPMVAWGIKIVCKKFEEFLTKIDIFLQNIARIANAVQVTICLLVSTSVY